MTIDTALRRKTTVRLQQAFGGIKLREGSLALSDITDYIYGLIEVDNNVRVGLFLTEHGVYLFRFAYSIIVEATLVTNKIDCTLIDKLYKRNIHRLAVQFSTEELLHTEVLPTLAPFYNPKHLSTAAKEYIEMLRMAKVKHHAASLKASTKYLQILLLGYPLSPKESTCWKNSLTKINHAVDD